MLTSFNSICLLVIGISYVSIIMKVRCGSQPQHHGAASRERKLTMTLLIVTVVSLLLYLPDMIYHFLDYTTDIISAMSNVTFVRLHYTLNFYIVQTRLLILYDTLSTCQDTVGLFLNSLAENLSNKKKLQFLFMSCNANDMELYFHRRTGHGSGGWGGGGGWVGGIWATQIISIFSVILRSPYISK